MPRPRATPPLDWISQYLHTARIDVDPPKAVEALTTDQWKRLQSAYRMHLARKRAIKRPALAPDTWQRLEVLRRRHLAKDLDELVLKLYQQ